MKSTEPFVHLHTHSHYSLLDGLASPIELATKAKKLGQPALAITDHGNMFGAIDFYLACKQVGIKPIIGLEAYVAPESRLSKSAKKGEIAYNHLTLLAKNEKGYKNLIKLSTLGYTEGFYYRPRIDLASLIKYKDGLIILSGCMFSLFSRRCTDKETETLKLELALYRNEFEDFYVEMQDFGLPEQQAIREVLPEIASSLKIPVVATNDVHYINKEDSKAHDALLCIGTGTNIYDEKRIRFPSSEMYLKSFDEMSELWPYEYLDKTTMIAAKCNLEIETNKRFYMGDSIKAMKNIERTCNERVKDMGSEYKERLRMELDAIDKTGYAEYIAVVEDFVNFAKYNSIPIGSGRGSSAGSLVCYLLGITDIDPIYYGLLFERFINIDRVEPPDIDVDVCQARRMEVIGYLKNKYGDDKVAQITSFGTMKTKAVIKDVCRVLQLPFGIGDTVSKMLGDQWEGNVWEAINRVDIYEGLKANLTDQQMTDLFDIASKIEGRLRHSSTHAAGVVVSDAPLLDVTPLYTKTGSTDLLTQYDMNSIATLGLLKFDILGLRTLTMIYEACALGGISPESIRMDDDYTFRQLRNGNTVGVFQYEGWGYTKFIKRMKPTKFDDLIALGALYRPGPLGSGMADDYVNRMHGARYDNEFPGITDNTYGILLYQEQIMKVVVERCGFTMNEADTLRKAIGKKDQDLMNKMLGKIDDKELVEKITTFSRYGWNKAHSVSYAMLSYRTAWLRFNLPVEFWCAMLNSELGDNKRMPILLKEAEIIDGVIINAPHINISGEKFTLHNGKLFAGLLAIKGIGEKVCAVITKERADNGPFGGADDLRLRIPPKQLNCKVFETLVNADVFRPMDISAFDMFQIEQKRRKVVPVAT